MHVVDRGRVGALALADGKACDGRAVRDAGRARRRAADGLLDAAADLVNCTSSSSAFTSCRTSRSIVASSAGMPGAGDRGGSGGRVGATRCASLPPRVLMHRPTRAAPSRHRGDDDSRGDGRRQPRRSHPRKRATGANAQARGVGAGPAAMPQPRAGSPATPSRPMTSADDGTSRRRALIPSRSAICGFVSPSRRSATTSCWRGVRISG